MAKLKNKFIMKKTLSVVAVIFTPIIVTLLWRLVLSIFGFSSNSYVMEEWWFWLVAAILSVIAIIIVLAGIEQNVD